MARLRKERKKDEAKWNEELMKDRQRKKESYTRQKGTLSAAELQERREKTRIKVQQCRLRKKLASIGQSSKPSPNKSKYKTPQSLGKAVKKVCAALPKSPGKQSIVVKEIIKKTFSQDVCKKLVHNSREVKK